MAYVVRQCFLIRISLAEQERRLQSSFEASPAWVRGISLTTWELDPGSENVGFFYVCHCLLKECLKVATCQRWREMGCQLLSFGLVSTAGRGL